VPPIWPSVAVNSRRWSTSTSTSTTSTPAVEWALAQGATLADYQPQQDVRVLFDQIDTRSVSLRSASPERPSKPSKV